MARVFITGSSDGLGLMVGRFLADQGHQVVLHARNDARAADAKKALPKAEAVVVGDLATIAAAKDVAKQVNALGAFDAIIHNAAVGFRRVIASPTTACRMCSPSTRSRPMSSPR